MQLPQHANKALQDGYSTARMAVRNANGLRNMLSQLQPRSASSSVAPGLQTRLRVYAVLALLGLAQDADIKHTLTKLQVKQPCS